MKPRNVQLIPAKREDRRSVYEWLAESDLTSSMIGPPHFPDHPIPTWEEFCEDYVDYFFDGSQPLLGRSFLIEADGETVGHINYAHDPEDQVAELDIWLKNSAYVGQGIGSEAIRLLVEYLADELGIRSFLIRPSARNERAIRAYEKAGFAEVEMSREQIRETYGEGDYEDEVILVMER